MPKILLEAKDIVLKKGNKNIINHLNLELWEGYVHAILGPNGAGKSTLSSLIMGLADYRDHDGDLIFEGKSINNLSVTERAKLGITLAWQEPARFEGVSVKKYLEVSAKNPAEKSIEEALNQVELNPAHYLNRKVDQTLSGGERKRIELASILLMKPKLVILDEPDSGIDLIALEKVFDIIRQLKKQGSTVLLITHSMKILKSADHAFLLCDGLVKDKGGPQKIEAYFKKKCDVCQRNDIINEASL